MDIRKLNEKDLWTAVSLVKEVFMEFEAPDYSEEGVENFLRFIKVENIIKQMRAPDIRMEFWGCFECGKMVGVLAVRSKWHVSLLFVDKAYHNRGIAKTLLHAYEKEVKQTMSDSRRDVMERFKITVNSSPYAVPIYEKMGFRKVKEAMTRGGIRFTPMEKMVWDK